MKNTILKFMFISILMAIAIPAHAASVLHIWSCELEQGKTPADAEAVSSAWLKAAKGMKGGDQLKVYLDYPIAANSGGGSFKFVLIAPSFEEWGVFNGGYEGSAAAKADEDFFSVAKCSRSSIWESNEIE